MSQHGVTFKDLPREVPGYQSEIPKMDYVLRRNCAHVNLYPDLLHSVHNLVGLQAMQMEPTPSFLSDVGVARAWNILGKFLTVVDRLICDYQAKGSKQKLYWYPRLTFMDETSLPEGYSAEVDGLMRLDLILTVPGMSVVDVQATHSEILSADALFGTGLWNVLHGAWLMCLEKEVATTPSRARNLYRSQDHLLIQYGGYEVKVHKALVKSCQYHAMFYNLTQLIPQDCITTAI